MIALLQRAAAPRAARARYGSSSVGGAIIILSEDVWASSGAYRRSQFVALDSSPESSCDRCFTSIQTSAWRVPAIAAAKRNCSADDLPKLSRARRCHDSR